jgi:O-antigen ligase
LPVLVAAAVVLIASPAEIQGRFLSIFDPGHPANVSRVNMWKTGLRIIMDHPLVGIGDVGTETVWDRYSDPGWQWEGHLHNNLIMWAVTLGLAGFLALVALFVKIWLEFAAIERELRTDWFGGSLALGGMAVLAGFHINGLFEWNFGDAEIITILWAITGLVLAAERLRASGKLS